MVVWRIGNETKDYSADDLSGGGAAVSGGRFNKPGQFVIYTSENPALAMLETAAHTDPAGLPLSRYLVRIEIPDPLFAMAKTYTEAALPKAWDAVPCGLASIQFGSDWYEAGVHPIIIVPSAIMVESNNILINAKHPAVLGLLASKVRRVHYDLLFRKHP